MPTKEEKKDWELQEKALKELDYQNKCGYTGEKIDRRKTPILNRGIVNKRKKRRGNLWLYLEGRQWAFLKR